MSCNASGAVVGSRQLTLRLSTLVSPELELYAGDMIAIGVQGPWVTAAPDSWGVHMVLEFVVVMYS